MDSRELASFVDQVVADADAMFGPMATTAQLDRHARYAVRNLCLVRPEVLGAAADEALHHVHIAFALRMWQRTDLAA